MWVLRCNLKQSSSCSILDWLQHSFTHPSSPKLVSALQHNLSTVFFFVGLFKDIEAHHKYTKKYTGGVGGVYAPETHTSLWLKSDQGTDCTGDVPAVIECEHHIASRLLQLGRQLQRPNWSDWWEIRCHMFPCETDNEPVNWCCRQICCFCFPQKISGEKNRSSKICKIEAAISCSAAFCRPEKSAISPQNRFKIKRILYLEIKGLSKTETHTHTHTSIWVTAPFCHWHHTALTFCPCHLRHLSLARPTIGGPPVWINLNQPGSCDIHSVSLHRLRREVRTNISESSHHQGSRFTQAITVNQCQMWECRSAALLSRCCKTVKPRQDLQMTKGSVFGVR